MFAKKNIALGSFILEYRGEIFDKRGMKKKRQIKYQNDNSGSSVYEFVHDKNNRQQDLL